VPCPQSVTHRGAGNIDRSGLQALVVCFNLCWRPARCVSLQTRPCHVTHVPRERPEADACAPGARRVLQANKFLSFVGSNVVESLSSTAMGMAIGAVAPSTEAALVLGPAIMLVFIVFGGLYTNPDDMPKWLKWLPNTSGIKTGYDALCKNEFQGLELDTEGRAHCFRNGDEVLEARGFKGSVGNSILQQGRIAMFHWWLTFCILKAKKPVFQELDEPEAQATGAAESAATAQ
jgi:hypothetical protein